MQDVNSIQQFDKLKHSLEEEDKLIRDTENDIKKKEVEHKKAKETFEKIDREMLELKKKKDELVHRRTSLENEFKNIQRSLEDLKRRGSAPLKF